MKVKDCICAAEGCNRHASSWFDQKPYCNKHWLRLYLNGDLKLRGKKIQTKYARKNGFAEGITSRGIHFKFDLDDWNKVTKHSWSVSASGYLVCTYKQQTIRLHRMLMNADNNGLVVDHINGDKLDNRKNNLRITTQKNNSRNIRLAKNNHTGVTGVSPMPSGKFRARIMVDGQEKYLGAYPTIFAAKQARKLAEQKYFGQYAHREVKELCSTHKQ